MAVMTAAAVRMGAGLIPCAGQKQLLRVDNRPQQKKQEQARCPFGAAHGVYHATKAL